MPSLRSYLFCESSPGYGGQEQQILETIRVLNDAGNHCILACKPGSEIAKKAEEQSVAWRAVPFRNSFDLASVWKIWRLLRHHKINVAFCHSGHDSNILRIASWFTAKRPVLIRVRTYQPSPVRARTFGWLDRLLVPSNFLRLKFLKNPDICSQKLAILHPLLDLERLQIPSQVPLPAEIEKFLQDHSPILVHAAMLRPEKGHKMALAMVAKLKKTFPQIGYVAAGGGKNKTKLEKLASDLGVQDHVLFAGFVSSVSTLLKRADLVIMPSLQEPLGMAQLEALAQGVPVAVSNAGGLPETVRHGFTGWVLPIGDVDAWVIGVSEALSNPKEARKRAALGYEETLQTYSLKSYVLNLEKQVALAEDEKNSN